LAKFKPKIKAKSFKLKPWFLAPSYFDALRANIHAASRAFIFARGFLSRF
jgi:hypothetical protein